MDRRQWQNYQSMSKQRLLIELERAVDQYDQVYAENQRLKGKKGGKAKKASTSRRGNIDTKGQKDAAAVAAGSGVAAGMQEVLYLTNWHTNYVMDNPAVWEHALVKAGVISLCGYFAGLCWKAANHYD
jgi:hypothetical protein